mmetsp:Transcript_12274/g.39264  ORF Transcript_12274/g.39264 Transcript_12274/m.39264 type:complete len:147 (-) Transcript_12274:450-890(-)
MYLRLLELAAQHVLTVEYNDLTIEHDKVTVVKGNRFPDENSRLAVVVAADALQHDGLGRYTDPVCPDADLHAMDHLRKVAELLVLSIPTGPRDQVVWNAHRIYGPQRLPLLLAGWQVLDSRPWKSRALDRTVFVLRPRNLPGVRQA